MAQITNKRFTLLNNSGTAVLRLGYDASNFTDFTPDAAGKLTMSQGFASLVADKIFSNDTANAFMTFGITLNQGGNSDEILALKSSSVAHGMTSATETDTYLTLSKASGTDGGVNIIGYTEATLGVVLAGRGVTDNTAKTTAGSAYLMLIAQKKSGTTFGDTGADANLFAIRNNGTTRFLFDAEGSAHADIEWTTF